MYSILGFPVKPYGYEENLGPCIYGEQAMSEATALISWVDKPLGHVRYERADLLRSSVCERELCDLGRYTAY